MRLPKRIDEVLKRKETWIAGREKRLQTAIMKMQEALLSKTMSEIIPKLETSGGKIKNTLKNYQLLASLDKMYKDFNDVQKIAFVSEIGDTAKGISKLNKNFFTVSMGSTLPDIFDDILKGTSEILDMRVGLKGGNIVAGSFLEELVSNQSLLLEMKQFMSQAVAAQFPTKTFIQGLNDIVIGTDKKPGGIDKQFQRFAHDIYMQYDSAYATNVADKAEMNYFIYLGGKIKDSRDFCVAHDAKVWTRKEAEKWVEWTPAKGIYPAGYEVKQKDRYKIPSYIDYPGYSPLIDRGGYNCRHHLGWISDELAEQMKKDQTSQETEQLMNKAKEAAPEVDKRGKDYAEEFNGTATDVSLKGRDSIIRKATSDYNGGVGLITDSVRTTVIVEKNQISSVIEAIRTDTNYLAVKVQTAATNDLGYSGVLAHMKTSNGTMSEMQVNTAKMIYAKEAPKDAIKILGEDTWNSIKAETRAEGGLGHKLYEEYRVLDKSIPKEYSRMLEIQKESKEYYKIFQ